MADQPQHAPRLSRYQTTRPIFPPTQDRKVIVARVNDYLTIQLRPFAPNDLEHVHRLRTQEAVMVNTEIGTCDPDLATSQQWMDRFLPPNDATTFGWMIWARQDGEPWEHIGNMGCHRTDPVPHLGYMLRTEWWGKRIATTAVQAFLNAWWKLERRVMEIDPQNVDDEHKLHLMGLEWGQDEQGSASSEGMKVVSEILLAEVEHRNPGSIKVVERCGLTYRARETITVERGSFVLLDYIASKPTAG